LVTYALIFAITFSGIRLAGLILPAPTLSMPTQAWNVWMVPVWMLWWFAFGYIMRKASPERRDDLAPSTQQP